MDNKNQIILPIDITGNASTNLIVDEVHILPEYGRVIKPNFTAYYTKSIIVIAVSDDGESHNLVKDIDYKCTEHISKLSSEVGMEICGSILINNECKYKEFIITYNAYGGSASANLEEILHNVYEVPSHNLIKFNDLLNKPTRYKPSSHKHDILDLYGLEYIVNELRYLGNAIKRKPSMHDYDLSNKINNLFIKYPLSKLTTPFDKDHLDNFLNVHNVTKHQIELGDVINYTLLKDYNITSPSSYSTDYVNYASVNYVSNLSANKFISDAFSNNDIQNYGPNSRHEEITNNLLNLLERADDLMVFCKDNISSINNLTINTTKLNNINTDMYDSVKRYKHLYWNYEVAVVSEFILKDKYSKNKSLNSLIRVPEKLGNLYLWIDFSDVSTMNIQMDNSYNYISSITDKSSYHRLFSQYDSTSMPKLIINQYTKDRYINKNTIANFTNGCKLSKTAGEDILLNNEYTIISLLKDNGTAVKFLCNDKGYISNNNGSGVDISLQNINLNSNIPLNRNASILSVISVSTKNLNESWCCINDNVNNDLGISNIISNELNTIITDLGCGYQDYQNFDFAELIIYNRQLSTIEINSLISYLSIKWSGDTDFNVDLNFVKNNI